MSKCEFCPVKCGQCIAEKTNHKAYCKRANPEHPEHTRKYIQLLLHLSCGAEYVKGEILRKETIPKKDVEKPKEYPSVAQQGKNFISSMAKFAKSGFELTGEQDYEKRIAICAECPSLDREAGRCRECGCFVRTKAKIKSDQCPLGKWEKPDAPQKEESRVQTNNFVHTEIVNGCDGCRGR